VSERTRDERIETYYHESAWDLAAWLVDAEDEAARLRSAWTSARRRAARASGAWRYACWRVESLRSEAKKDGAVMRGLLETLGARSRQTRRYRSAWLSARRRAVDEFNHGAEALALRDAEIARLKAEQPLRQSMGGAPAPELECAGAEEDGSTVWRLKTPK
jgi:hypothetical protein